MTVCQLTLDKMPRHDACGEAVEGTLILVDRLAADRPFYPGKQLPATA